MTKTEKGLVFFLCVFVLLFSLPLFSQTGENPPPGWKGKIKKQNGVNVIKNPQQPLYGDIELELEEDLKIGSATDENSIFYKWIAIDIDNLGNIFVLDTANSRIQKFDRNGKHIQTIGRKGQGPGEFENPRSIMVDEEGKIFVKGGPKLHAFDSSGHFIKTYLIPSNTETFKVTLEGKILGDRRNFNPKNFAEQVVLMDQKSVVLKTIASFPSMKMDAMFAKKARFTIDNPEICFCPYVNDQAVYGFPEEYKLCVVNSQGAISYIIENEESREKISGKEKKKIIDKILMTLKARNPKKKEERQELERRTVIPKYRPFFDEIRTDEQGNLYVRRLKSNFNEERTSTFDVYSQAGFYLYKIKTVDRIAQIKSGYIYRTDLDRETGYFCVKRYKIKNLKLSLSIP